jgi:hypothetical protein
VTLAAILTVILLPWALVTARRSLSLAGMTLAMLWRGEAWKTVFLQSEQRVLELERQLPRPILSNTGFFLPESELPRAAFRQPDVGLALGRWPQLRSLSIADAPVLERRAGDQRDPGTPSKTPQVLRRYIADTRNEWAVSLHDQITAGVEKLYRSWPNTSTLYDIYCMMLLTIALAATNSRCHATLQFPCLVSCRPQSLPRDCSDTTAFVSHNNDREALH